MDKNLDFTKRLLSYSAVGAAAALGAGQAQGAIIANTTPQNFDVRFGQFAFINYDGSGPDEFVIAGYQTSSSSSFSTLYGFLALYKGSLNALHFEDSNAANGGGNSDPNALPVGFFIGPGGSFDNETSDTIAGTTSGIGTNGNFPNFTGQVRYIGTQFQVAGNTHYGWIGVQLNPDFVSGTVTGYAYEACAGQGIDAGATTGGATCAPGAIPEPSSLALMAAGAAGLFALRRRRQA